MTPISNKKTIQFWVAVPSVVGCVLLTGVSMILDSVYETRSDLTLLMGGGLLSVASSSAGWLFRNGNGEHNGEQ